MAWGEIGWRLKFAPGTRVKPSFSVNQAPSSLEKPILIG